MVAPRCKQVLAILEGNPTNTPITEKLYDLAGNEVAPPPPKKKEKRKEKKERKKEIKKEKKKKRKINLQKALC